MNHHLQSILKFIEQDKSLSADEKKSLLKSLKDADKELEITAFKLDQTEKVKRTNAILLEETIEELEQKRKAVEAQNRELEIESSLEKVRTVAMGMKQPENMLDVCRMISDQLQQLGFKDIRNVQTVIIYESKHEYLNYQYFTPYDKNVIELMDYRLHPDVLQFTEEMLKSADSYYTKSFRGKELQVWRDYRKQTNQLPDPKLDETTSAHYYFYSIGNGALGLSTYAGLNEEHIAIFKRFRNVFDLAYRRFIDIEKAIAQAKEAQIETSLERIRAQAMSMRTPNDLLDICEVLFTELHTLGFTELRNTMINIHDDDKGSFLNYDYSGNAGKTITNLFYNTHPVIEKQVNQARSSNDAFSEAIFTGKDLDDWKEFRKRNGEPDDPKVNNIDSLFYYFYSIGTGVIGISTYSSITEEKRNVLKRFRNVFDLAYRRFLDIEQAEAQAREAKIELGLERVRARATAMRNSDELSELVATLFNELTRLDLILKRCIIWIFDPATLASRIWMANSEDKKNADSYYIKRLHHPYYDTIIKGWQERSPKWVYDLQGSDKRSIDELLLNETELSRLPEAVKAGILSSEHTIVSGSFNNFGLIEASGPVPQSEEQLEILNRFAKVFDLTYTRFNDLQKAEAQAREAKIEASLERVRSKAMAMHKSDDLNPAVATVFEELEKLNLGMSRCGIGILDREKRSANAWITSITGEGTTVQISGDEPMDVHPLLQGAFEAWLKQEDFSYVLQGKEMTQYYKTSGIGNVRLPESQLIFSEDELKQQYYYLASFQAGGLFAFRETDFPEEAKTVMKRFANVFNLTYKRFLDLQKAEAQAREALIEVSLERVRSRTMAMHSSEDLSSTVNIFFKELKSLGIIPMRCGVGEMHEETQTSDLVFTTADKQGELYELPGKLKHEGHPVIENIYKHWKMQEEYHPVLQGTEINAYYKVIKSQMTLPDFPEYAKHYGNYFYFKEGFFFAWAEKELSEEGLRISRKFTSVLSLTYKRYKDLKQAETQAREAKIETALEKVRSRTMAMQKSDELADVAIILFKQVSDLGIKTWTTGFNVWSEDNNSYTDYITSPQGGFIEPYTIDATEYPVFIAISEAKKRGEEFFVHYEDGQMLRETYRQLSKFGDEKQFEKMLDGGFQFPSRQFEHFVFGPKVSLMFITYDPVPEAWDIFKRFGKVFEQTYTRFLDLQKAEAQAREAQIETALEKVRSRTLAMQKSDELAETAAVVFSQLIGLGIAPNRLYIGIVKDEGGEIEYWITDEDGSKVSQQFTGNANRNESVQKIFTGWKAKQKSLTIDMQGEELKNYFHYLADELSVPFKGGLSQKRRVQTVAYFGKGFIGIASPDEQPEETSKLLERFAAVFNLTFTRFNDLKIAEAHAEQAELDLLNLKEEKKRTEDALAELQITQKQLIQSEKMASLGELTAGIAHEIQNPLNFVNNFSEVSTELLDEMITELGNDNKEDAIAIADDVKQNLEKILHHGKRADGIVKGMLQHSRSSSGVKEPTAINKLADEYLHLAYHGLRAKDKSFNATLKTDYDESIGSINIIPQDIGRAILNLITNAFYAVTEKKKQQPEGYEPIVSMSTRKEADKILLSVKDNGNGIPQKVLDKIFQPFFTTKPTGQGTGLGLSLAYDIVKAHGGEIKVETKLGKGSDFIIELLSK